MEERKASDILIELESSVKKIESFLSNIDLTNKIILKNQQTILDKLASSAPGSTIKNKVSSIPSMPSVEAGGTPVIENRRHVLPVEISQPVPPKKSDKVTVTQRVAYSDNKNVILAQIEIFDSSKKLVKKTRTDSSGRWNGKLEPGNFLVYVKKSVPEAGKSPISKEVNIKVFESEKAIELDTVYID